MESTMTSVTGKLTVGTVFRVVGLGLVFSMVPFSLLMGFLSLFGAETITWNGQPVTGVSGLISSPLIGLFVAGVFTALLGSFISLGLWIYSWFRELEINIKTKSNRVET